MNNIMVSIICIAYNHEKYIANAIESFLRQKVDFKYEIIIHDDASTDQTASIIKKYQRQYPNIIYAICQKENQYSKRKSAFMKEVYSLCNGKYIAFCEGDDFWIDVHKLQIQVEWMESHPQYTLTAHNAVLWNCSDGTMRAMNPYFLDREIEAKEIIMQYNGNLPTASIMIRADVIKDLERFLKYSVGDIIMQFCCMTKGKIYYFDRIMSVYRYLHINSWSFNLYNDYEHHILHCIEMINFLEEYNKYTCFNYDIYILSKIHFYIQSIIHIGEKRFLEVLEKQDLKQNKYSYYFIEIKRIFSQTLDETYFDVNLEKFISNHKHVVIFGAGDYALRVARQLNNNQIKFEGFAVSDLGDREPKYLGKMIWNLKKIPFKPGETGIIVAINPIIWNQIYESLEENKIIEYICPFLFRCARRN